MKDLLKVALSQFGIQEIHGEENNPEILKYSIETGINWIKDDETPWCSIFVNWCALKAGYEMSKNPSAKSWLNVGTKIEVPEIGCICLIGKSETDITHVCFYDGETENHVNCLGGNQCDRVKYSMFKKDSIFMYRKLNRVNYV